MRIPVNSGQLVILGILLTLTATAEHRYRVTVAQPSSHYCEVEATFEGTDGELMMAVWTPGSYMVREYSRQVEALEARDPSGNPVEVEKTRKNRWKLATTGPVTVRYLLYCREMSVRNNWIDDHFGLVNGAPTFLVPANQLSSPASVEFRLPQGWQAYSGLPQEGGRFRAEDYDQLVDCPFLLGKPEVHTFEVEGKPHFLLNEGDQGMWDGRRAAADLSRLVQTELSMWGELPYSSYLFMNLLTEARGGLEHRNSTVVMSSAFAQRKRKDYLGWLSLMAHEYFHVWNVKRLRPAALGPFDYENEVYTRSLWVAEGITSYYDDLMVRRSGLASEAEYLEALSESIDRLQTTPGRQVTSLSQSSFDAWIKLYRPDENSVNSTVSYYNKGLLVAWLLDTEIRMASGEKKCLDDVMRAAYAKFSDRGYQEGEFRSLVMEVAGTPLTEFFDDYLDGTQELNYDRALKYYGLRFAPVPKEDPPPGWTGLITSDKGGRLVVREVPRGVPAYGAGFNVEDELIAIDGMRIVPSDFKERLNRYRPGDRVEVTVARRKKLRNLSLELGEDPGKPFKLELDPGATAEQNRRRNSWLGETGR